MNIVATGVSLVFLGILPRNEFGVVGYRSRSMENCIRKDVCVTPVAACAGDTLSGRSRRETTKRRLGMPETSKKRKTDGATCYAMLLMFHSQRASGKDRSRSCENFATKLARRRRRRLHNPDCYQTPDLPRMLQTQETKTSSEVKDNYRRAEDLM